MKRGWRSQSKWPMAIKHGIHFLPDRYSNIAISFLTGPWPSFHIQMVLSFFTSAPVLNS